MGAQLKAVVHSWLIRKGEFTGNRLQRSPLAGPAQHEAMARSALHRPGALKLLLLKQLQSQGVDGRRIRLITALCASPGLKLLGEEVPDLTLHTACIDEGLTAAGTIQPGIGDPLRRLPFRMSSHD